MKEKALWELQPSLVRSLGPPLLLLSALPGGCASELRDPQEGISSAVEQIIAESGKEVAVYYRSLEDGDSLLINPDLRMHAASTMKVPVMIQLYLDRDAGLLALEDSLEVVTTFNSIVDGSPYELALDPETDGDLPERIGGRVSYAHLVELMITLSSNLATNILIQEADARRVTATMRQMGADSIEVLRGVEDGPAFRAGLSNTTTARDLGIIMEGLGRGTVGAPGTAAEMLEIMSRQHWSTKIPALLPRGARVAHKTGRITGISHDSGIVFPGGAPPYVLIILTRGFEDGEEADALAARISRLIFDHHTGQESSHDE